MEENRGAWYRGPGDDGPDAVLRSVSTRRAPEAIRASRSVPDVLEWAGATLPHIHIEDGALTGWKRLASHQGAHQWARTTADALATLDAWAEAMSLGWDGSVATFIQAYHDPAVGKIFRIGESQVVESSSGWWKQRVRGACPDAEDPGTPGQAYFDSHARIGDGQTLAPRMHFKVGRDGRVHIGYWGKHLENSMTRFT